MPTRFRFRSVATFLVAATVTLPSFAIAQTKAPRAMQLADWYRVTVVSNPAISPDGQRVAMQVQTYKEADNKRHNEIWVVASNGNGTPQRWTSPGTESTNPRWSPDGKWLVFNSTRTGGKGNTWALRVDEPGGEATQPGTVPTGSSPKNGAFAVWSEALPADTADKKGDPYAKMTTMSRPPFDAITKPTDPARYDGRHIVDFPFKSNDRGFIPGRRTARQYLPTQLWRQVYGDTAKKQLTKDAYSHRAPSVSPDGQWIAFLADARLRSDSAVDAERDSLGKLPYDAKRDEVEKNDVALFVMSSDGGTPKKIAEFAQGGGGFGGGGRAAAWSPDGKQLAWIASLGRLKSQRLWVADAAGGAPTNVIGAYQFEPGSVEWLANGTLQFSAAIGGRTALLRADVAGKSAPTEIIAGRRRLGGFAYDPKSAIVAYTSTSLTKPTELFVANADGSGEKKLTSFNDALNAEVAWSDAERFTYKSVGGLEIEAWLMKPYGYDAGKKYPLVEYIHGGPHSAYGEDWFDEFQNLAAAGMFVLFTNPRGSSGYGADFTYSTRGRWGMEDYEDLMKAVDIVAQRPDVDATKLGATGGSYGGFMTTWIATKTNRFKAIETDRTITEWTYWYGASDAQGLTELEFYGKPWDNQSLYDRLSPIRYVAKVKTPMLMVQSEDDFRTAMGSAEIWYTSLKKLGVPVELVRYPRSNHDLSRTGEPWLLVDRLGRLRQWFGYWLLDQKNKTP
jgi:dipeptidyl aminopeptidase/acylaminoacyl peptidase